MLAFLYSLLRFIAATLARVHIGEKEIAECFQFRFPGPAQSFIRQALNLVELTATGKNGRKKQIGPRAGGIVSDQRTHVLFGPGGVTLPQQKVAEVESGDD